MQKLKSFILILLLLASVSVSYSASTDTDYVNSVSPKLYQDLEIIQQCEKNKTTIIECKKKLSNDKEKQQIVTKQKVHATTEIIEPPKNQKWWLKSVYDKNKPEKNWQNAVDGSLSLSDMSGNEAGTNNSLILNYMNRYNTITTQLSYNYAKYDYTDYNDSNGEISNIYSLNNAMNLSSRFDLNEKWFFQLGYDTGQDTDIPLEFRDFTYLGVGAFLLSSETLVLTGAAGIGRLEERFSAFYEDATGMSEYDYNEYFLTEKLTWNVTKKLTVTQNFSVSTGTKKMPIFGDSGLSKCIDTLPNASSYCVTGHDNLDHFDTSLEMKYQLNEYFNLSYTYTYTKDPQPILDDASTNTVNMLSVSFNYQ